MKKWIGGLLLGLIFVTGCSAPMDEVNFDMLLSPFDAVQYEELAAVTNPSVTDTVYAEPEIDLPQGIVPVRIEIPAINVDTVIENVGVLDNGEMGVPEDDAQVGWFEPGYLPGMNGNSVMAGHEDNWLGPAIFFDLRLLKEGDEIYIYGDDGTKLTFAVYHSEDYLTEESPIEQIFGQADEPMLNLITCAGTYDRQTNSSDKRLVVYTKLIDETKK